MQNSIITEFSVKGGGLFSIIAADFMPLLEAVS